jgi:hypothetical protein
MTQPLNHDDLARHLYVHGFDHAGTTDQHRAGWAAEWDDNRVDVDVVAYFHTKADQQLAKGASR